MKPQRNWKRLLGITPRPEQSVEDEIRFHIEMRAKELIQRGVAPDLAQRQATERFGDQARVEAECRALERARDRRERRLQWLEDAWHDVRVGARVFRRETLLAATIVISLGIGIGANAGVFSIINAFLFRPLAVARPEELVSISSAFRDVDLLGNTDFAAVQEIARRTDVFSNVAAFNGEAAAVRIGNDRSREFALAVNGDYFTTLQLQPQLGRLLTAQDDRERAAVVVITDAMWDRKFGRDPQAVGSTMYINGFPTTIIGITQRGFEGTQPLVASALFLSSSLRKQLRMAPCESTDPGCWSTRVFARVRPHVNIQTVRTTLATVANDINASLPAAERGVRFVADWEIRTRPEPQIARSMPLLMGIFMSLASLALLVVCANVTNLLLARAVGRRGEIAVRQAIGASKGRIMRQLVAESTLLAAAALLLGVWITNAIVSWIAGVDLSVDAPLRFGVTVDWRVFAYSALLTLSVGLLAGLAPALFGRRVDLSLALRDGGRGGSSGRARARWRAILVSTQVAVSVVLLIAAALFTRSALSATKANLGFRTDSVAMVSVDLTAVDLTVGERRELQRRLVEVGAAIPGVQSAALSNHLPFDGNLNSSNVIPEAPGAGATVADMLVNQARTTSHYFETMGYRVTRGRAFSQLEAEQEQRVAVINEVVAEQLWPGTDAIGKRFRFSGDTSLFTVVGVVSPTKVLFISEADRPFMYRPLPAGRPQPLVLAVRTRVAPSSILEPLRAAVSQLHPELVPYGLRTIDEFLRLGLAFFFLRVAAVIATLIGAIAMLQTLVGLYGILAYLVNQRQREIGIRMALGALPGQVVGDVLRQAAIFVGAGLAVGLALTFVVTKSLGGFLVGVSSLDATAYLGGIAVLLACAFLAAWLPARRAALVPPSDVLRADA